MNTFQKIVLYLKKAVRLFQAHPSITTIHSTIKYLPAWLKYNKPGANSVKEQLPWITLPAIHAINKLVKPEMTVFEYGSGGSTLYWASRVKKIISLEHDKLWFEKMELEFKRQNISNVDYFLIAPEADSIRDNSSTNVPGAYRSARKEYAGKRFETYVKKVDEFPDEHFDVIVVDGRARPSCIHHALPKIKKNGYLIVDNTERPYYLNEFNFHNNGWVQCDYPGPGTFNYNFSQTTILKKIK